MTKKTWILSGAAGVALVGAGLGWWYWQSRGLTESTNTIGAAVPLNTSDSSSKSIPLGTSDPEPDPNALKVTDTGNGQTGLANGQASSNSGSSGTAETPDKFSAYDKYKDATSALFGEMVVGTGPEVVAGKEVTVNYRGWLTDGRLFDDSYAKGKPFMFVPGEHKVIAGWEQGVLGMKVGGKRRLIVPPAVGYGVEGKSPIPANAVLVFDIELVGVQ